MMNFLQAAEAVVEGTAAAIAENAPQVANAIAEIPVEPEQSWFAQNSFLIMIGLMFLVMWLFMWRPEAKRRKQMQQFRKNLKKGDKIITAGGIYGVVKEVKENDPTILIEVDGNVTLRIDKNMIVADPSSLQQ